MDGWPGLLDSNGDQHHSENAGWNLCFYSNKKLQDICSNDNIFMYSIMLIIYTYFCSIISNFFICMLKTHWTVTLHISWNYQSTFCFYNIDYIYTLHEWNHSCNICSVLSSFQLTWYPHGSCMFSHDGISFSLQLLLKMLENFVRGNCTPLLGTLCHLFLRLMIFYCVYTTFSLSIHPLMNI